MRGRTLLCALVAIMLVAAYVVATHEGPYVQQDQNTYNGDVYQVAVAGDGNYVCTGRDCDAALVQQSEQEDLGEVLAPLGQSVGWRCYTGCSN